MSFYWKYYSQKNVLHLLPNHYLKVNEKSVKRFFPMHCNSEEPLEIVAEKSAKMLKGYISAISQRSKLKMAVTGGYDSRLLFLASLDVKCKYYVSKHHYMSNSHHDIIIPKHITKLYNKDLSVEIDSKEMLNRKDSSYINDIDFPRFLRTSNNETNYTYINGNISEIARNYFGYHKKATAKDLSFLAGYSNLAFAIKQYSYWLKNKPLFDKNKFHYLDMFYWEEKMGNWAAKAKAENNALGRDIVSPYNSRTLLCLLLSSQRKDRDSHYNHLYNRIISVLSDENKEILQMPINSCRKQTIIRLMKRLNVYNLYRHIGVKTRKLNV